MQILEEKEATTLVRALSDQYSRDIISSTIQKAKTVESISSDCQIPISTCYRRIHELVSEKLMIVDRVILTDDGRKYETFKSAFREASITFQSGKLLVEATSNKDAADRFHEMMSSMRNIDHLDERHADANTAKIVQSDLTPKSLKPILSDCDLCGLQGVWCRKFSHGDSKTFLNVCGKCEIERMGRIKLSRRSEATSDNQRKITNEF
jgi:hypothetical protein